MPLQLETQRLVLRPFERSDAARITELLSDPRVAEMMSNIPFPYSQGMATNWIDGLENDGVLASAVQERESGRLLGCVSFPYIQDEQATLGYWPGCEYWGRGYATEAMAALMRHARDVIGVRQFKAMHLLENTRSRSVILKLGLQEQSRRIVSVKGAEREVVIYELFATQ